MQRWFEVQLGRGGPRSPVLVMRQDEISGSVSVTYSASMQAGAIYVMALQPGVSDETSQDREK